MWGRAKGREARSEGGEGGPARSGARGAELKRCGCAEGVGHRKCNNGEEQGRTGSLEWGMKRWGDGGTGGVTPSALQNIYADRIPKSVDLQFPSNEHQEKKIAAFFVLGAWGSD